MAVLGAAAGLEADDALDLDLGAAPLHPHLVGEREQLVQALVGQRAALERLLLGQALAALEHLLTGDGQDVGLDGCLRHDVMSLRRGCAHEPWV